MDCRRPGKRCLRLQLQSKSDFISLQEVFRMNSFTVLFKRVDFDDYIYKGTDWEVSIRVYPEGHHFLHVKTGMEETDGVASQGFFACVPIPGTCLSLFRGGLEDGYAMISAFLSSQPHPSADLAEEFTNVVRVAHKDDHPVYQEVKVQRWDCKGRESLNFNFTLRKGIYGSNEDQTTPFTWESQRAEEHYWLEVPIDTWSSPEALMNELQVFLRTLGITAIRNTIEKSAERITAKKDVKIRIYSSYGYSEFLNQAPSLMTRACGSGTRGSGQVEKVEHIDYYYDTLEKHLEQSHCTLRFRGIRCAENPTLTHQLTLQSSISVCGGQQKRDWVCLPLSGTMAEKIQAGEELVLEELGKEAELWKAQLHFFIPLHSKLVCVAGFSTTRHKFPWFSSKSQPIHKMLQRTSSQTRYTVHSPLIINLDHTVYGYVPFNASGNSSRGLTAPIHLYEVEVANIEVCPEQVMKEMEVFLEKIDVEWQLSVNNKLQQFFELQRILQPGASHLYAHHALSM